MTRIWFGSPLVFKRIPITSVWPFLSEEQNLISQDLRWVLRISLFGHWDDKRCLKGWQVEKNLLNRFGKEIETNHFDFDKPDTTKMKDEQAYNESTDRPSDRTQ